MTDKIPTAIDFVEMYTHRVSKDEFDDADDMMKAAAVLARKADEILKGALPDAEEDE